MLLLVVIESVVKKSHPNIIVLMQTDFYIKKKVIQ